MSFWCPMKSSSFATTTPASTLSTTIAAEGFVDTLVSRASESLYPEEYIRGYLYSLFDNMKLNKDQLADLQKREADLKRFI